MPSLHQTVLCSPQYNQVNCVFVYFVFAYLYIVGLCSGTLLLHIFEYFSIAYHCICSACHLWTSLLPSGSRQWNQEVLCLTQPPPSSSTHCKGIWQCKESSSHSAAALLQCRETRHAQNVPPFSHSGGGRPLLPVTDLNHQIQGPSFLFLTPDLYTAVSINYFVTH